MAMNYAEQQRKLLALIKGTYSPSDADDPYLRQVAASRGLAIAREVATFWRLYDMERYCVLTSRLLKARGVYEETVADFVQTHALSAFINEVGESFLLSLAESEDPLLSEVASFELALTRVKRGDSSSYTLDWQHDPAQVLACLVREILFDPDDVAGRARVVVSAAIPEGFRIEPLTS
jgi:hypothetical protein